MPTPVSTARQCLTHEAALALDDAVSVARRRSHVQTTSLHAVSSLLSLPSSPLREACSRARSSAYTCRIQFKALELCLGVSLDRLPSSAQRVVDEPPVSNSLMAAIKRSQANQRRQPEHFQFYQQQQQQTMSSGTSVSTVKVELQNMILSILDDPVVSRVFADAGFRSCDIKLAIARPVHQFLRYKSPPLFLCNSTGLSDSGLLGGQGFSFPFMGGSRSFDDDENFKKIVEILVRKKNPLLLGVSANGILENLLEMIRNGGNGLPSTLSGLTVTCIQNDVSEFVNRKNEEELLKLRLEEVGRLVQECIGAGLLVNFGDLKVLLGGNDSIDAAARYVVGELARLVEVHKDKIWLVGATAKHETYFEFLNKFPSIERDWDLQLLTLVSPRPPMGQTYPRSSIMESFVPFGGFFSTPSDMKRSLNGPNQYISRCHLCNEKCKQEVTALAEVGFSASVADQYQSSLPSWLQMTELSKNRELDAVKAKDSSVFMRVDVEKKWDGICQHLHQPQAYSQMLPKGAFNLASQVPPIVGFQVVEGRKENFDHCINITNASSAESGCEDVKSCRSMDLQQFPTAKAITQLPLISKSGNLTTLLSQLGEKSLKIEELSARSSVSCSSVGDDRASQMSANSVTMDLGLGVSSDDQTAKYSTSSRPVYQGQGSQKDFKTLYKSLSTMIGRQEEAIAVVNQTIARRRTRNDKRQASRGDVWFVFTGPDKIAKKKIAMGLAETLYGSSDNFICVDLNLRGSVNSADVMFNPQLPNICDVKFRGKTIVDYIAEELSKKPLSVVFLENVDMADLLAQSHLSRALRTGRFSDSHGREISISNAIFVATMTHFAEASKILTPGKELAYSEEDVLRCKGCPFQMIVGFDLEDVLDNTRKTKLNSVIMNKRKLVGSGDTLEQGQALETAKRVHKASSVFLDLNLPAEESEIAGADHESVIENTKAWLKDFFPQVDETICFKPFDFDALAEKLMKVITECFCKTAGSAGLLEIDSKVIEQILAAACLLGNTAVEDWIEQVLGSTFVEAQKRYTLSSRTVVKLVTCEGGLFPEEEQPPGNLLPAGIIMN